MDIKALKFNTERIALIIVSAIILSACSGSSTRPDTELSQGEEQTPFEPRSGAILPEGKQSAEQQANTVNTQGIQLAADYPSQYTVKRGDTLWDIANMFLKDPWYWPEIWQRNPQVKNPHLIYPGDILTLIFVDGQPTFQLTRPGQQGAEGSSEGVIRRESVDMTTGRKTIKLSPRIHRRSLDEAIPSIPADALRQFLTRPRVVTTDVWANAPYIVGSDDDHMILGANNKIYIRGDLDKERIRYSVFRQGNRLEDPDTGDLLGFEIIYAGQARITKYGLPSTALLLSTSREVIVGDRLLPSDKSAIDQLYFPHLPEKDVNAKVISLFDAISSIAKYQIAVINRGSNDGMEVGHLLATYSSGGYARDRFLDRTSRKRGDDQQLNILLPDERSGVMMLFKVFDQVSYGLVLKSTRTIKRRDAVKRPR